MTCLPCISDKQSARNDAEAAGLKPLVRKPAAVKLAFIKESRTNLVLPDNTKLGARRLSQQDMTQIEQESSDNMKSITTLDYALKNL